MYLIEIGLTRIKTETDIIHQIRAKDQIPLIQDYDSKRWIYVNAEQISTITVLDDNGELPPNPIVKDVVNTTLGSLASLFTPKDEGRLIIQDNKEADE